MRVDIVLTSGKHLHDCIISLSGEVWSHKTILTMLHFIEVPIPSEESERLCVCELAYGYRICSMIVLLIILLNEEDNL